MDSQELQLKPTKLEKKKVLTSLLSHSLIHRPEERKENNSGLQHLWELLVLSLQLFYKSETILKLKAYLKY